MEGAPGRMAKRHGCFRPEVLRGFWNEQLSPGPSEAEGKAIGHQQAPQAQPQAAPQAALCHTFPHPAVRQMPLIGSQAPSSPPRALKGRQNIKAEKEDFFFLMER